MNETTSLAALSECPRIGIAKLPIAHTHLSAEDATVQFSLPSKLLAAYYPGVTVSPSDVEAPPCGEYTRMTDVFRLLAAAESSG